MPVNISGRIQKPGAGWGCSCKAHRQGDPSPETVRKALLKAAAVTAEIVRIQQSRIEFVAWSNPEDKHHVVFDQSAITHGFCKHILACIPLVVGEWARNLWIAAELAESELKQLRKERKEWKQNLR